MGSQRWQRMNLPLSLIQLDVTDDISVTKAIRPAIELILMIEPPCRFLICGSTAFVTLNVPTIFNIDQ